MTALATHVDFHLWNVGVQRAADALPLDATDTHVYFRVYGDPVPLSVSETRRLHQVDASGVCVECMRRETA